MTKARDLANAADVLDDVSSTELSYVNGVTSAIQTQLDAKVAKSLVDAKGDLLVGSANDTVSRLAVASTAGYVLTVDSAETTGLKWAAPAAGGKVLQVVYADTTTQVNIASTSYTDTGLSASITPSSTSSKVLVLIAANAGLDRSSNTGQGGTFQLLRGSTAVMVQQASAVSALFIRAAQGNPATNMAVIMPLNYLDSPATTSSVTYKLQGKLLYTQDSGNLSNQVESTRSTMILLEIGA
jgi:hypothetical protein